MAATSNGVDRAARKASKAVVMKAKTTTKPKPERKESGWVAITRLILANRKLDADGIVAKAKAQKIKVTEGQCRRVYTRVTQVLRLMAH